MNDVFSHALAKHVIRPTWVLFLLTMTKFTVAVSSRWFNMLGLFGFFQI